MQSSTPYPPEDPGAGKRRSLFGGRAGQPDLTEARIEEALAGYQEALERRLDQGLLAIQDTADRLMKEIASEMWRTGGGDTGDAQDRILAFVTRDQTVRSVLAHSDERFQSLAMRTERLEQVLRQVSESNDEMKQQIARSAQALAEAAQATETPAIESIDAVRRQLERVEQRMDETLRSVDQRTGEALSSIEQRTGEALSSIERGTENAVSSAGQRTQETLESLLQRDEEIVRLIQAKVSENGAMVATETGRVAEAMQTYVQGGVDVMGRLAQRVEEHMAARPEPDGELTEQITRQLAGTLGEQISLIYERLGMEGRTLADSISSHQSWLRTTMQETDGRMATLLHDQAATIRDSARTAATAVSDLLEARVTGLAQLVRSDSEALRNRLVERTAAQDEAVARLLDERLARVSEAVEAATRWTADEATRRISEVTDQAVEGRMEQITLALDRNLIHIKDALDLKLSQLGHDAAEAADQAVAARMDQSSERLAASVDAIDQTRMTFEQMQADAEATVVRNLDQRMGALAKMIRSDNRALAQLVEAGAGDRDSAKQTLRSVKELQANLGDEVVDRVERKLSILSEQLHRDTQSIAESLAKTTDLLSRRIDRIASQGQTQASEDVQVAIERMGEAMHALAAIGRQDPPEGRIDLGDR